MSKFIAGAVLCIGVAFAQPAKFEAASIKPASPEAHGSSIMTDKAGGLTFQNGSVRALVTMAYGIRDFQLSGGPGWIGNDRYDIVAKPEKSQSAATPADGPMSDDERKVREDAWKERVRNLLAERFGLVVHPETKEQQVYALTVAKGGPKMTVMGKPGPRQGITGNRGRSQGFAAPMSLMAMNLSNLVGRIVIDKTGLTEKYDWVLEYDPDISGSQPQDGQPGEAPRPTIFTALQDQLGLRLESTRGPVDTYVIDHIDRPSEN
jgi:bla regulator protein blaR1